MACWAGERCCEHRPRRLHPGQAALRWPAHRRQDCSSAVAALPALPALPAATSRSRRLSSSRPHPQNWVPKPLTRRNCSAVMMSRPPKKSCRHSRQVRDDCPTLQGHSAGNNARGGAQKRRAPVAGYCSAGLETKGQAGRLASKLLFGCTQFGVRCRGASPAGTRTADAACRLSAASAPPLAWPQQS